MVNYTNNIRNMFKRQLTQKSFRNDNTIELRGISFVADSPCIFGTPNQKYIDAEIEWYETQDKSVVTLFDIYGKTVEIWDNIKDDYGEVNSNYGWCIYSKERGSQYRHALVNLLEKPHTRQAVLIYQHPDMHMIAGKDFTCTNSQQFFINDDRLDCVVQMRSQDAVYGYNNDIAWFKHVRDKLLDDLNISRGSHGAPPLASGPITMQIGSLHIYPRHQHLVKEYK